MFKTSMKKAVIHTISFFPTVVFYVTDKRPIINLVPYLFAGWLNKAQKAERGAYQDN